MVDTNRPFPRLKIFIGTDDFLLGINEDLSPQAIDKSLVLEKNDVLVLYTDGIVEAWEKGSIMNQRDEHQMFTTERLAAVLEKWGGIGPHEIKKRVLEDLDGYTLHDDATIVIMKRTG